MITADNIKAIPAKLFQLRQWCVWRLEPPDREGAKWKKMPRTVTGGHGDSTNPARWVHGPEANDAYEKSQTSPKPFNGIGFVFYRHSPFRFTGIDFDGWTWEQVKAEIGDMALGYVELSQSGGGIHVIVKGILPPEANSGKKDSKTGIEAYDDERYFAITGNVPPELPQDRVPDLERDFTPELAAFYEKHLAHLAKGKDTKVSIKASEGLTPDDQAVLTRIKQGGRYGRTLHRLFYVGEQDERKQSEGDYELAAILCRFTPFDDQVERLMWASAMVREKWKSHQTLVATTVANARADVGYPPDHTEPGAVTALTFGDKVKVQRIEWAWYGRLAFKKFSGLIGMPDVGKDTLSTTIAAHLSTEREWPDGRPAPVGARPTIYLSGEDAFNDTLLPRFLAAGGDPRYIAHFPVVFRDGSEWHTLALDKHLDKIREHMLQAQAYTNSGPGLLILSPFDAFLSGKVDAWKSSDIRRVLAPMGPLLEDTGWGLLAIAHPNKGGGKQAAIHRISNSQAFAAALRVAYCAGKDPVDDTRRVLVPMKRNILPPSIQGLSYRLTTVPTPGIDELDLTPEDTVPAVKWSPEPCTLTPEEVLAGPKELTAEQRAEAWVYENVPVGREHAVLVEELQKLAKEQNRSWRAINDAANRLKVGRDQPKGPSGKLGKAVWWFEM